MLFSKILGFYWFISKKTIINKEIKYTVTKYQNKMTLRALMYEY